MTSAGEQPRLLDATSPLVFVRNIGLPVLVTVAAVLLSPNLIVSTFVVLGQSHFVMMYIYQYRGGRMKTKRYGVTIILALAVTVAYFMLWGSFTPLLLAMPFFFGLHFAVDEFYLQGEKITRTSLVSIAGFVLLYFTLSLNAFFPQYQIASEALVVVLALVAIIRLLVPSLAPSATERYLWLVEALACVAAFAFHVPGQVLALIILLHYFNWFIGYAAKVQGTPRARQYWMDNLITFTASLGGFLLFVYGGVSGLKYVFAPAYYYAWTFAHFIFASRWVSGTKTPLNL